MVRKEEAKVYRDDIKLICIVPVNLCFENQSRKKENRGENSLGRTTMKSAPAHDVDTSNTVVQRIIQVVESFNRKYVALTVDQALFPSLMELKWVVPEYKDVLIPRLGLHIQDSGLPTIWTESSMSGPRTVQRAFAGKDYNKATRVHKITTLQAMWQLLLPQRLAYIEEKDHELKQFEKSVQSNTEGEFLKLLDLLASGRYRELLSSFIPVKKEKNPNLQYWLQNMDIDYILLFIRAQREGIRTASVCFSQDATIFPSL